MTICRACLPGLGRRSFLTVFGSVALFGCGDDPAPTDSGARAPDWTLPDFQPLSTAYGQSYGLNQFRGSALLVALLNGSCNTCIGIAYSLETLQQELNAENMNVRFCAINEYIDTNGQALVQVCSFPLFQDSESVNAWAMHGGTRDDIYVYSKGSELVEYYELPAGSEGNPASDTGREQLKSALLRGL